MCELSEQPIPNSLRRVFAIRELMLDLATRLLSLQGEVLALQKEPGAARLNIPETAALLSRAYAQIVDAAPYAQCNCWPGVECNLCHKRKWISAGEYRQASGQLALSRQLALSNAEPRHSWWPGRNGGGQTSP